MMNIQLLTLHDIERSCAKVLIVLQNMLCQPYGLVKQPRRCCRSVTVSLQLVGSGCAASAAQQHCVATASQPLLLLVERWAVAEV